MTGKAIGIDFGTSTSLVAEGSIDRRTLVVPLGHTTSSMPSWVAVQNGGLIVGEAAQDLPLNVVAKSVKNAITHEQDSIQLEGDSSRSVDADAAIVAVLREVGQRARSRMVSLTEDSIRLGCPAIWDGCQRARLLSLAQQSGLPVADHTLVDEPIAAGVAWVTHRINRFEDYVNGKLLVFDMGGGTLDIALLDIESSKYRDPEISVLASVGIDRAGDELDKAIARDLCEQLDAHGISIADQANGFLTALILQESRRIKELLSEDFDADVIIRHPDMDVPRLRYSRVQLENAIQPQLNEAVELVWAAIRASRLTNEEGGNDPIAARRMRSTDLSKEVKYVLLAGGMSRIPAVGDMLGRILPTAQIFEHAGTTPEEAIVAGLADPVNYQRINLHRPGFDFYIDLPGFAELTVYKAHTPLYSPAEAVTRGILYYEKTIGARELPSAGFGWLRARTSSGNAVNFKIDGKVEAGIPVRVGRGDVRFRLYPNGRILVVDGRGQSQSIRVNGWPVLRGADHAWLVAKRIGTAPPLGPDLVYPHGPLHG